MTVHACGSDSGLGAVIDSNDHSGDENWIAHLGFPGPLSPRAGIVPPTPLYNFGEEVCFSSS